ncbi:MAG: molybdopterin-dependent oxidoreductase [Chloroflexota bacterium]
MSAPRREPARAVLRRAAHAYRSGIIAAVPATVLTSGIAIFAGWPSPLEATAEQVMEWTPVGVAEFLLFHLGNAARPAALVGALAITMFVTGSAGVSRVLFGCGFMRQLIGTGLSSALLAGVFLSAIPSSNRAAGLCFVAALIICLAVASTPRRDVPGRRAFLQENLLMFGGIGALLTMFTVQPLLRALTLKRFFPFHAPAGLAVAGLTPLITPSGRFYQMDKVLQYPAIGPPSWILTIEGIVDKRVTLDYGALLTRHAVDRYVTVECVDNPVGGPLIGTALWTGVPVEDLLRLSGARGDTVVFQSADDYEESAPRAVLEQQGALIAYVMNGEALPRSHGYPARLILPGIYGFKSVKWITHLRVVNGSQAGNWHAHGWTEGAPVHTTTRIDVARREGSDILVAGIAFGGARGIRAVEVRANGGPWRRANLGMSLSFDTWVQWAVRLRGSGLARIEARAIDGDGVPQTPRRHAAYPDGSTGWASAEV